MSIVIRPFELGPIGITHGFGDDDLKLEYFKLLFSDDMLNNMSVQTRNSELPRSLIIIGLTVLAIHILMNNGQHVLF